MLCKLKAYLLLFMLMLMTLVTAANSQINATSGNFNFSANNNHRTTTTTTHSSTRPVATPLVAHRFRSANNITILHEVHDDEPPLVLNTHEVLPLKPLKKKPYALFEKTLLTEYERTRPLKEYELHPVTFDFNLGDLEDLEHEDQLKSGGEGDDFEESDGQPNVLHDAEQSISYTELPELIADAILGDEEREGHEGAHRAMFVGVAVETTSMPGKRQTATMISTTPKTTESITPSTTESTTTMISTTTESTTTLSTTTMISTTRETASTTTPAAATTISSQTTPSPTVTPPFLPPIVTVSPHIFKIIKTKAKIKGRELLKKDSTSALGFNGISRYFGSTAEEDVTGAATDGSAESANMFQLLINLYDHFYWQPSEIRNKVSTGCGIELQAYLTALNANYEWAQRAYDASGRYRGQAFYGNDKWLGEKAFCYELNRQIKPEERKHFEFQFYVALISIRTWLPGKVEVPLQLGECLPKTCSPQDIQAVLAIDPHAHMLGALSASNSSTATKINILRVRKVPGNFNFWLELKFQLFVSFMSTLIAVVVVATWYQAKLNRQKCFTTLAPSVNVISAKIISGSDAQRTAATSIGEPYNGKVFEIYQMSTLNDNNNVDIESDLNANNNHNHNHGSGNSNSNNEAKTKDGPREDRVGEKGIAELELKTQLADYKMETCSSASATPTYEAKQKLGVHQQVLLCFAFQTNASVIMDIDDSRETQTSCVHGMRVFSVLWTILVHTYLEMFTIGENRFTRIIVERSIWYQFVGNATFSVDTFFFISGFLVTLLSLKQQKSYPESGRKFLRHSFVDTAVILIYRYVRLTPAYLFVIFFNDFFLRQTFDSSVFQPSVAPNSCSLYWWRNIFYINNFYPLSEICMIWSWYMANDMQFYVMASVLLIISTRYFKSVLLVISSFLFSSWAVSGIISLHHNYTHKVANPFESFDFLYDKPWQRVGTYIMGMVAGYIMYKVKNPPKIKQRTNLLLWAGSLGLLFLIIFGVWDGQLSVMKTSFYVSIGHTAFGFALIWIVLSCCWGYSNPINRVLAYRGLWPLSRLTYCTYLIHPVLMLITSYRMEGTVHLNNLFVMTIFLGNAVLSFGVAFFISVLFEAPVIRLLKISFRK